MPYRARTERQPYCSKCPWKGYWTKDNVSAMNQMNLHMRTRHGKDKKK